MRAKALLVALSQKLRDGHVLFVDNFENISGKTKDMKATFDNFAHVAGFQTLNTQKHNNVFFTTPETSEEVKNGTKNLFHVTLQNVENLNVLDIMNYRYLVLANPEKTVEFLQTKLTQK
jgi:ribosomal protein L4